MDIGEQRRLIIVEPEPLQVPAKEPVPEREPARVPAPEREKEKVSYSSQATMYSPARQVS